MWSSRYQLAFFVVGAALLGVTLERYLPRKVATAIAALMLLYAVPFVVANRTRSLIPWSRVETIYHPRPYQYFLDAHSAIAPANLAAADFVNHLSCNRIALDVYLDDPAIGLTPRSMYVYPLLSQIHADGQHRSVWYSGVENDTARYPLAQKPCAVICMECARVPRKWDEYRNVGGRASVFDYIVVFSDKGAWLNSGESQALAQAGMATAVDEHQK
jgi:hypothetical protein